MIFSKLYHSFTILRLGGQIIEHVNSSRYLGCILSEDLDPDKEIKCKIEAVRDAFNKLRSYFCDDNISLKLKFKN